jgi:integrase
VELAAKVNLKISFHDLRHTHASLLMKAGVYPKKIPERLGHSEIGTTINIYGHLYPGDGKQCAEKIDEPLGADET